MFPFYLVVACIFVPLMAVVIYGHFYPEWLYRSVLSVGLSVLGFKQKRCGTGRFMYSYAERGRRELASKHLLLVHGFTSSKEEWSFLTFFIPSDVHIMLVDLPGHGETSDYPRGESYTIQTMVKRLHKFVVMSGMDETPFHIVGQSLGGAIAGCYAASHPELITNVTLICPAMDTPYDSQMIDRVAVGEECPLTPSCIPGMRRMFSEIMHQEKFIIPWVFMKGMLETRQPREHFHKSFFRSLTHDVNSYALIRCMHRIRAPTQLIWGQYDQILDISGMETLEMGLPNLQRSEVIRNAGHVVNAERPRLIARLIDTFHRKNEYYRMY